VSPNLPGIAHIAGHKLVSTTTQYVHSNREQTRAVLNARPGIPVTIPVTDSKLADLNHVAEVLTLRNHNASEGGGIGRRAGFRLQDQNPNTALSPSETRQCPPSGDVTESPQWTHCGHGDRNEQGVVAISDVRRAAAALLRRVADDNEIPIGVLREFAELVLRSELVEACRQVLEGPPEFAVRRALELASLVLGGRVVDDAEKGKEQAR